MTKRRGWGGAVSINGGPPMALQSWSIEDVSDHLEHLEFLLSQVPAQELFVHRDNMGQLNSFGRDDLLALCAECRRLRQDVATLNAIFGNDLAEAGGQFAAGLEHGAARQLAECLEWLRAAGDMVKPEVLKAMRALGAVRPPLPAERLAEENARLREALSRLRNVHLFLTAGRQITRAASVPELRALHDEMTRLLGPGRLPADERALWAARPQFGLGSVQ